MVVAVVLIVLAVIGFIVGTLPSDSNADTAAAPTLNESFLIFALTVFWPGVVLLTISLVGLYMAWQSQTTSRKRTVLVLGLNGSGKSHVATGIVRAAEKQGGGGAAAGSAPDPP